MLVFCFFHGYIITTITSDAIAGEYCYLEADFFYVYFTLVTRATLEIILMIPFVLKAYHIRTYRLNLDLVEEDRQDAQIWLGMSLKNFGVTSGLIVLELIQSQLSNMEANLLNATYSVTNCLQAVLIVFLVEDLRKNLQEMADKRARKKRLERDLSRVSGSEGSSLRMTKSASEVITLADPESLTDDNSLPTRIATEI